MNTCCDEPVTPVPKVPPVEFCVGNYTIAFENGRMVKIPRMPALADGVYQNATITMVDGCITAIAPGTNVVYSACDPCVTPVPPPPPSGVTIDGNSCNLTSNGVDGLLTLLVASPSSCINVTGCGNAASPLQMTPIISPDAGNTLECRSNGLFSAGGGGGCGGANFSGCGIFISNGCVVGLPLPFQPVLDLYNDDGTMTISRDVGNPCSVRLRVTSTSLPGLSLCTMRVDNTAGLPPTTTQNGFAVVGVAPGAADLYTFVCGIGWLQVNGATVTLP